MNWTEFTQVRDDALAADSYWSPLYAIFGEQGENNTRFLLERDKALEDHNLFPLTELDYESLFGDFAMGRVSGDGIFVCLIHKGRHMIRTGTMNASGHPALAGTAPVFCAGEITSTDFKFQSGHYRPTKRHVFLFMCRFIDNSCQNLLGNARDAMVQQIAAMPLTVWRDENSSYSTRFGDVGFHGNADLHPPSTPTVKRIEADRSARVPLPVFESPEPIVPTRSRSNAVSSEGGLGVPTVAKAAPASPQVFQDFSKVAKCQRCSQKFGVFRSKYTCGKCGRAICKACRLPKKAVRDPAVASASVAQPGKAGAVRICLDCGPKVC